MPWTRGDEHFDRIRIGLASPEKIRSQSHGEVTKPETIHYRTFEPVRDGLFCTAIFGPTTDWECLCGKYKHRKYRGLVCKKCGTERTLRQVRHERMGHVELAVPCAHIWFLKVVPSQIGTLLDIQLKDLERVLYYQAHLVVSTENPEILKKGEVITEARKQELDEERFEYRAVMGATGVKELLRQLDLHDLSARLRFQMQHGWSCRCASDCECEYCPHPQDSGCELSGRIRGAGHAAPCRCRWCCNDGTCGHCPSCSLTWRCPCRCGCRYHPSEPKKLTIARRLKVVEAFAKSANAPEWMILDAIPVIPPELRPLVRMSDGRFATSDLNHLYLRVIHRNNRLRKLRDRGAPELIVRNEMRMLQEAVDALLDNGRRSAPSLGKKRRSLKSLTDLLQGKRGLFRRHLLGKRVDYSGRSVIVPGPELKLHQCGLPRRMALELFKPFVMQQLIQRGFTLTVKRARGLIRQRIPAVYDILHDVIQNHPVLLNRIPTLHQLSIQAFEPVLVEGSAIKIHPLVCRAFNANFRGDEMVVHVPLSLEAQTEAKVLMLSANNILSPANSSPIVVPSQDVALGVYYLTTDRLGGPGEGRRFGSVREMLMAREHGLVETGTRISLLYSGWVIDLPIGESSQQVQQTEPVRYRRQHLNTTVGRVILNDRLPDKLPFVNGVIKQEGLSQLVEYCCLKLGHETAVEMLDSLKDLGFQYSTLSGMSVGMDDMVVPQQKEVLVDSSRQQVMEVERQFQGGAITPGERSTRIIEIWANLTDCVAEHLFAELKSKERLNPVWAMSDSGACGSEAQLRQLSGMRGLITKVSRETVETPIIASLREGLDIPQYLMAASAARMALSETELKAASSGYLNRRLVNAAQDVIITEADCGTRDGIEVKALMEQGGIRDRLQDRIVGRVAAKEVWDIDMTVLVRAGQEITEELAANIEGAAVNRVMVRSALTCETRRGLCQLCYGRNLATGLLAERGETVGILAAQSIGAVGTQLPWMTHRAAGIATLGGRDSAHRVKSLGGLVKFIDVCAVEGQDGNLVAVNHDGFLSVRDFEGRERERYRVNYGTKLRVADGDRVVRSQVLAESDPFALPILTEAAGRCHVPDMTNGPTLQERSDEVPGAPRLVIKDPPAGWRGANRVEPRIEIRNEQGVSIREYVIPTDAHLMVRDGDLVREGDVLAQIQRETTKAEDVAAGLSQVAALFEARKPKEPAIVSELDGKVEYGALKAGYRLVTVSAVTSGGQIQRKTYKVRQGEKINFRHGETITAGEALTDGPRDLRDLLKALGEKQLQQHLVSEIQAVYRGHGVRINDQHVEVIVRQMMRWVEVEHVGDAKFRYKQVVDKHRFARANREVKEAGGTPAVGRPLVQGITKSVLATDSFIAAASFQLTTKVLTEAAVAGKVDGLRGLREKVIAGRMIPAGTGLKAIR